MSVYHTPRCRITWTAVVPGDVAMATSPFGVEFGLSLDTAIWSNLGNFAIDMAIYAENGQSVGLPYWRGWTPTDLPGRPASNIWLGWFWNRAFDATGWRVGVFLFRPSIQFRLWQPGGAILRGEFAVAEEDHFFAVEL
jgi:hypothetical protein